VYLRIGIKKKQVF